jgi:uncharacterized membrane protein
MSREGNMKDITAISFYWLHLGAATFWVGGIAFILLIALPSSKKALGSDAGRIMGEIAGRFGPLANWCILMLIATGVAMTGLSSWYGGVIPPNDSWSLVLLAKLVLVSVMVAIHFFRGLVLSRMITQADADSRKPALQKLSLNLVKVNLALGAVILLFSGALSYLRGY